MPRSKPPQIKHPPHQSRLKREWSRRAALFVSAQAKQRKITNDDLARRLSTMGYSEPVASIAQKLESGTFPAWLLFAAMDSMSVELRGSRRVGREPATPPVAAEDS